MSNHECSLQWHNFSIFETDNEQTLIAILLRWSLITNGIYIILSGFKFGCLPIFSCCLNWKLLIGHECSLKCIQIIHIELGKNSQENL